MSISRLGLATLLAALAACAPVQVVPAGPDEQIDAFTTAQGIAAWPRLDGCQYAEAFGERTVGLILHVGNGWAQSRWDGRCHVPIRHDVQEMPANLPAGVYVVAARAVRASHGWDRTHRTLRIKAVLGAKPADRELQAAALRRICRTPGARGEDRDCDD